MKSPCNAFMMSKKNTTPEYYMKRALVLSKKGEGYTRQNPLVGAVVVKDSRIISTGWHMGPGTNHAEVDALLKIGDQANGADLYVNLEPCNHQGSTPPCTQAILNSGISRVFYGSDDPNPNVKGGGGSFLERNGVEVFRGILKKECDFLNRSWLYWVLENSPYVILKLALTSDNSMEAKPPSRWITSNISRSLVHRQRRACSCIAVGEGTIKADNPFLNNRSRKGPQPVRAIFSKNGDLSPQLNIFKSEGEVIVLKSSESRVKKNPRAKYIDLDYTLGETYALKEGIKRLGELGFRSIYFEGGIKIASLLLDNFLCNEYIEFKNSKARGLERSRVDTSNIDNCYSLVQCRPIGTDDLKVYIRNDGFKTQSC